MIQLIAAKNCANCACVKTVKNKNLQEAEMAFVEATCLAENNEIIRRGYSYKSVKEKLVNLVCEFNYKAKVDESMDSES